MIFNDPKYQDCYNNQNINYFFIIINIRTILKPLDCSIQNRLTAQRNNKILNGLKL